MAIWIELILPNFQYSLVSILVKMGRPPGLSVRHSPEGMIVARVRTDYSVVSHNMKLWIRHGQIVFCVYFKLHHFTISRPRSDQPRKNTNPNRTNQILIILTTVNFRPLQMSTERNFYSKIFWIQLLKADNILADRQADRIKKVFRSELVNFRTSDRVGPILTVRSSMEHWLWGQFLAYESARRDFYHGSRTWSLPHDGVIFIASAIWSALKQWAW